MHPPPCSSEQQKGSASADASADDEDYAAEYRPPKYMRVETMSNTSLVMCPQDPSHLMPVEYVKCHLKTDHGMGSGNRTSQLATAYEPRLISTVEYNDVEAFIPGRPPVVKLPANRRMDISPGNWYRSILEPGGSIDPCMMEELIDVTGVNKEAYQELQLHVDEKFPEFDTKRLLLAALAAARSRNGLTIQHCRRYLQRFIPPEAAHGLIQQARQLRTTRITFDHSIGLAALDAVGYCPAREKVAFVAQRRIFQSLMTSEKLTGVVTRRKGVIFFTSITRSGGQDAGHMFEKLFTMGCLGHSFQMGLEAHIGQHKCIIFCETDGAEGFLDEPLPATQQEKYLPRRVFVADEPRPPPFTPVELKSRKADGLRDKEFISSAGIQCYLGGVPIIYRAARKRDDSVSGIARLEAAKLRDWPNTLEPNFLVAARLLDRLAKEVEEGVFYEYINKGDGITLRRTYSRTNFFPHWF